MLPDILKMPLLLVCTTLVFTGGCFRCTPPLPPPTQLPPDEIVYYTYEVINEYPHDPEAFTQGLDFANGHLYEGTGLRGASSIRKVALETGEVLQYTALPQAYFGEGITVHEDRLIQLTWKSQVGFVYDLQSFRRVDDFSYLGEGWGLTHDGNRLIMSDGTARLRFLDLETFATIGQLYVRYGEKPVIRLNELEYIDGLLYANIWQEDRIAIICLESGYVVGWADMTGLLAPAERAEADVFNGIAYDPDEDRIFVTGKLWPRLFEVALIEERTAPYPAVSLE